MSESEQPGKASLTWFRKVAENGNVIAQEFLGRAYEKGWMGLPPDAQQSSYWYERAAKTKSKFLNPPN